MNGISALEIVWCLAAVIALIGLSTKSVNEKQHIHSDNLTS